MWIRYLSGTLVTVPEVRMSPDLKIATCYVMPLGGKDVTPVLKALAANQKMLRTEIARRVELKSVPSLRFLKDTSFDEGARIDACCASPRSPVSRQGAGGRRRRSFFRRC